MQEGVQFETGTHRMSSSEPDSRTRHTASMARRTWRHFSLKYFGPLSSSSLRTMPSPSRTSSRRTARRMGGGARTTTW